MKYKVVILALFMAHWESISGCSGSKSPDGTVETTGRGLYGKKQFFTWYTALSIFFFVTDKQVA